MVTIQWLSNTMQWSHTGHVKWLWNKSCDSGQTSNDHINKSFPCRWSYQQVKSKPHWPDDQATKWNTSMPGCLTCVVLESWDEHEVLCSPILCLQNRTTWSLRTVDCVNRNWYELSCPIKLIGANQSLTDGTGYSLAYTDRERLCDLEIPHNMKLWYHYTVMIISD